jgi:hypothetical protein
MGRHLFKIDRHEAGRKACRVSDVRRLTVGEDDEEIEITLDQLAA